MAKSLIRNTINGRRYGFIVPADDVVAGTFAAAALDGEYSIYLQTGESGTETEAAVLEYTITGKNNAGAKTTFSFYAKPSVTENDIHTALIEKTFNGVKFDEIYIISARSVIG
ncbi:hypothetical protein [Campylobacter sp. RM9328]|uniref:hypothetical protein n=1 Tax=Campylobacter sp. RM9328 TaxID=1705720 RepID=UPI001472E485|nr:hypothetical protein [Campylobacter sp. RM9328]